MEKITKREMFEALIDAANGGEFKFTAQDVVAFAENEIALLDKKAVKAKERAATKKAEGDELTEVVKSLLTDEWQTAKEITAQIEGEDITQNKVIARVTKLINAGVAVKEQVSVPDADGKATKKMGYRLAQ
jgi:hypothetical protein